MTKRTRNGRKRNCKTSCLARTFFSFCKRLLDKKKKKEKKKIVAIHETCFSCKWSVFLFSRKFFTRNSSQKLLFAKVFVKNFAIFWSRENFCSRKFLPRNYYNNLEKLPPSVLISIDFAISIFSTFIVFNYYSIMGSMNYFGRVVLEIMENN